MTNRQLEEKLQHLTTYYGPMPDDNAVDPDFYAKKPVPHPTTRTIKDIIKLIPRIRSQKRQK